MNNFLNNLKRILDILSQSPKLDFKNPQLPQIAQNAIMTSFGDVLPLLSHSTSPLPNQTIDLWLLEELVSALTQKQAIVRLDHIGFCYRIISNEQERKRLLQVIGKSTIHLYEEPSNDSGLWFFVGDVTNWENPVIELIPVETTEDPYQNLWLPHIQIDIDTTLSEKEIAQLIDGVYDKKIQPFPISIEGVTYIVRCRLGIIDGVNIFLDIATKSRDVQFTRQKLWKQID